jgi:hypothetical protein
LILSQDGPDSVVEALVSSALAALAHDAAGSRMLSPRFEQLLSLPEADAGHTKIGMAPVLFAPSQRNRLIQILPAVNRRFLKLHYR